MSLVTTAISQRSRSARQSASVNAVLPDPTGPPLPTRRGCAIAKLSLLRTEKPRVLTLVTGACQGETRREARHVIVVDCACAGDHAGNMLAQGFQQTLPRHLAERDAFDRRRHLRFKPRPDIRGQRGYAIASDAALTAYVWSWLEAQVAAAIKCVPLGQVAGQRLLKTLGEHIPGVVAGARAINDDDVTSFAPGLALASARHESQYTCLLYTSPSPRD